MTVGPQFRRVGAEEIDWHRVSQLTLVPFLADGQVVLDADGECARLVAGAIEAGEHPLAAAPTRIALEQCGFRRQATHPFAVTDAGRHVAMWVDGDRYAGDRAHKQHATWWTGTRVPPPMCCATPAIRMRPLSSRWPPMHATA